MINKAMRRMKGMSASMGLRAMSLSRKGHVKKGEQKHKDMREENVEFSYQNSVGKGER